MLPIDSNQQFHPKILSFNAQYFTNLNIKAKNKHHSVINSTKNQILNNNITNVNQCLSPSIKLTEKTSTLMNKFQNSMKLNIFMNNYQKQFNNSKQQNVRKGYHFDFNPPLQNKQQQIIQIKHKSTTLSPRKSNPKSLVKMGYYEICNVLSKQKNHKRRVSEGNISQLTQKNNFIIPQKIQTNNHSEQNNPENSNKKSCKIKIFQINDHLSLNCQDKIIHSHRGPSFLNKFSKRRTQLNKTHSNKNKSNLSPENKKIKTDNRKYYQQDIKQNNLKQSKLNELRKFIFTAGGKISHKIQSNQLNFTPLAKGFFPHTKIINEDRQCMLSHTSHRARTNHLMERKVKKKQSKIINKQQQCRPWSPLRAFEGVQEYEEEQDFQNRNPSIIQTKII